MDILMGPIVWSVKRNQHLVLLVWFRKFCMADMVLFCSYCQNPNSTSSQLKSWVWNENDFRPPPPLQTQCHRYLSYSLLDFNQIWKVALWDKNNNNNTSNNNNNNNNNKHHFIYYWSNFAQTLVVGFLDKTSIKTTTSSSTKTKQKQQQ